MIIPLLSVQLSIGGITITQHLQVLLQAFLRLDMPDSVSDIVSSDLQE
jgi:hypothetical protein